MFKKSKLSRIAIAVAMTVGMSTAAMAQVTSSGMTGQIVGPNGNPALGTIVKVTHVPTGAVKRTTVNTSGSFNLNGLRIGGPYTIELDSDKFADQTIKDVYLSLGETSSIIRTLAAEANIERIAVTSSQINSLAFGKMGPSATFDLSTLENAPALNRNLTDIVRIDPRIYVDEGGSGGIQCAGKSPRFNSLTVDGVRMNDLFGLNFNGYPTERMPFSFDAIEGVAVEIAPFDVIYGGFSACNISAVSKTGTNEVHGTAFFDYGSNDLRGDSLEGDAINIGDYTEKRYGFSVGAPLIKDTLFIFAAYEKLEGANLFDRGPIGSGAVNEINITQGELDEIARISKELYGYDPGSLPTSIANEDEKLLVKLDWNISEQHRASFTYNWNDGYNFSEADRDSNEFEFSNHLYERGAELTSYVGVLYSDWTDKFSTEIRLSRTELGNRQNSRAGDGSVGGNDFGEIRVETDDVDVYLGSDDSRQANKLDWTANSIMLRGNYYLDNGHSLTFGYESDTLEVFNLFVQHTETEIRFEGVENFENGFADAIYYNNAISGNLADAAADWSYTAHSVYFQDEFYLTDDLNVVAGLRYDWYTSSDKPAENAGFVADYGFSNSANLDGIGLLQPRIGLNYTLNESTEIRGGIGLFSGGNPNVWMSNNYSNTNTTQVGVRGRSFGYTDGSRSLFDEDIVWVNTEDGVTAGPGYSIPSELDTAVASGDGSNFDLNYLDPNFEMPSEWKLSAGMTHITDSDYILNADLMVSFTQDQAMVLFANLEEVGFNDEGYIDYDSNKMSSLELTNSEKVATSYSIAGTLEKSWDNGLRLLTGYSYNHSEDSQPMTNAIAFSSYHLRAFTNPNEDVVSLSDYNIAHRFTADFSYKVELFAGLETRFNMYAVAQSGSPYSLVRTDGNSVFGFTPYLDSDSVLPIGSERNSEESPWWIKADIAVRQEIPAFTKDHSASISLVINNFTNMLNDSWGILEEAGSNRVDMDATTRVIRDGDASLWEARLGINYKF
jgi:hypothetical protein